MAPFVTWDRIRNVGGVNSDGTRWKLSQAEAIVHIERKGWTFFVRSGGKRVDCIFAVSRTGNKYIKTKTDGEARNKLLCLPECLGIKNSPPIGGLFLSHNRTGHSVRSTSSRSKISMTSLSRMSS
ncbi:DUF3892 domain-containing protein [Paracoccus albus]|uniref:DUF3892 domain-containing protein n=1 Tax=Paracoccus albus TaxID=3017784 RepID=UPI00336A6CE5